MFQTFITAIRTELGCIRFNKQRATSERCFDIDRAQKGQIDMKRLYLLALGAIAGAAASSSCVAEASNQTTITSENAALEEPTKGFTTALTGGGGRASIVSPMLAEPQRWRTGGGRRESEPALHSHRSHHGRPDHRAHPDAAGRDTGRKSIVDGRLSQTGAARGPSTMWRTACAITEARICTRVFGRFKTRIRRSGRRTAERKRNL